MADRRWWIPLAFIVPFGVLALFAARQGAVVAWIVYGAAALLVAAMVLRALRSSAHGHRVRSALGPAADGFEVVQGIYLARPDVGPVTYGRAEPPDATLVVDTPDPDPADLREVGGPA